MTSLMVLLGIVVSFGAPPVQAKGASDPADRSTEFHQLTQQRFDAYAAHDRSFYERLLAPNFLLLGSSSPPQTKQEYLGAEFPLHPPQRGKATITDLQALVEEDTAVVSYQVVEPHLWGEQRLEERQVRLDTYVRMSGAWRLLSSAAAEPASWPDVAPIEPRLYLDYAGTYLVSADTLVTVSNEAGHLMVELTGQEKTELFPESATTFFDKTDSPFARTVFERDAFGKVVAQIYRFQGQQMRFRKIQ